MVRTRAQRDLIFAERCVSSVLNEPGKVREIYGGLCLRFPIFVLTCGLCQAVAFSEAKAQGEDARARAHKLLLAHVGELLGVKGSALEAVRDGDATAYRHQTRRALGAWVYFKRFAISILKADEKAGED